ncbi:MAG TPA: hypothetical protein VG326_18585 [Tepidisphaeraceae bacterium]|jgi:hypothetical protein|nr:hypothetical protein [Tepidisphaeraceae bacterium]
MSQASVETIVKEIESLSEEDRETWKNGWRKSTKPGGNKKPPSSRGIASKAGIDQASIDSAIYNLRHE